MPTIKEKLFFNYDGIWSESFGLINVVLDNSMFDEMLVSSREILEVQIKGNDKPLFQGISNSPIEFEMTIAFTDRFTDEKVDEIVNWLFTDYYKPLYFSDREDRIFYCMPIGDSRIIHNGINQGYFTINMRCNSPYTYSPMVASQIYDLTVDGEKIIEIFNDGYGYAYPEISIEKVDDGEISISNMSDGGRVLQISNIANLENVYLNCEKKIIESDIIGVYHYDDISGEFPKLTFGRNLIRVNGKCRVQFRYQFKYRF